MHDASGAGRNRIGQRIGGERSVATVWCWGRRSTSSGCGLGVAAELGYEVTVVRDATADYGDEEMHAALDINLPHYASAIVTTAEIVESLSALST